MSGGCASAPPEQGFAEGVVAAGVSEPIEFVGRIMPTNAVGDEVGTLTIDEAVRRTLRNDPAVQAAIAEVHSALADARQSRLLPNPVLSVAVRFPEGGGEPVIEAGLAADLVSLLQRPRQISAADHRLRAASSEAMTVVLDSLAEVQERYANVQAIDARIGVLEQRKKLVQRLSELAKARLDAGESSRLDLITFDTERVSLDVEITQAASERREQRLILARLIGQPSGPIEWELTPWSLPTPVALEEAYWVRAALKHRPEVQSRRWELAALGDEVALAKLAVWDGTEVGADAERDPDWSVGPAVTTPLPFFDWGQQRRAKAEAERAAARHRLTQTRRLVIEEARRAVESLSASQATLRQVQTQLIPLADQRVQQSETAYKNGAADVTAVLLAEQEAQAARSKQIELQQAVSSATYRLHRAVGGPGIAAAFPTTPSTNPATTHDASQPTEHP